MIERIETDKTNQEKTIRIKSKTFYIWVKFFKFVQKVANNLGYFFRNFVAKNFKNRPIWSH